MSLSRVKCLSKHLSIIGEINDKKWCHQRFRKRNEAPSSENLRALLSAERPPSRFGVLYSMTYKIFM